MMYGKENLDKANWKGKYDINKKRMSDFLAPDVAAFEKYQDINSAVW